jgi:IclR family transcriptional regulator, KDG regulon repressor
MPDRYLINSILRAGNILKCFSGEKAHFKVSEVARLLHLDRSTTYRILLTLERGGFLEKDAKTGEYALGVAAFEVGRAYLGRADFARIAKPIMSDLALQVQETVHLAILSQAEILYVDKVDSPRTLGVMSKVGQRGPVYCTALGKVLLAFLPDEERSEILRRVQLKPLTRNTITSRKGLLEDLKEVRRRGYARDHREIEEDVECLAAPIRNHLGEVIAGISISGPQRKIQIPREKMFAGRVMKAAALISSKLGHKSFQENEITEVTEKDFVSSKKQVKVQKRRKMQNGLAGRG